MKEEACIPRSRGRKGVSAQTEGSSRGSDDLTASTDDEQPGVRERNSEREVLAAIHAIQAEQHEGDVANGVDELGDVVRNDVVLLAPELKKDAASVADRTADKTCILFAPLY